MNLEFKFENNLYAKACLVQKIIEIYKKEQWGDCLVCKPILYTSDNELVDALKKVSERINLDQYEEVTDVIYRRSQNCDIRRADNGSLIINAPIIRLGNDVELVEELIEVGAEFVGRHLNAKIMMNGVCVAEITYS